MTEDLLGPRRRAPATRGSRSRWPRWCAASGRPRPSRAPRRWSAPTARSPAGWAAPAPSRSSCARRCSALRDGQPRLIGLVGEGGPGPGRTEGILEYPMTCHSGGTLEIYVEPYLPKPLLVLVGHGPVVEALATLGRAADYAIVTLRRTGCRQGSRAPTRLTRRASVVVATHGESDEEALARVLATEAGYVSLVASRRRAAVILERLQRARRPAERLAAAQGARRTRHRRGDARGDRGEHPRRDHPAPPEREASRGRRGTPAAGRRHGGHGSHLRDAGRRSRPRGIARTCRAGPCTSAAAAARRRSTGAGAILAALER